jgi:transcriptional regulator with XRE-family HTH domain
MKTFRSMGAAIQSSEHERLGRTVKELRTRRGLSQEMLGERSGLHRNYVGAIERGEINPTFKVLMKLARGLDFELSEIMELWEERSSDPPPRRRPRRAPQR